MIGEEQKGKLFEWDRTHVNHPLVPCGQKLRELMFDKGKGAILWDVDGKEYIDFCAHLECVNLGYGQSELVAVCSEQMQKLGYSTTFFGYSNRPSIECSMKLAELTPEGLNHFIFTGGGSESTETAFQLARLYWSKKGNGKYKIISQYNGYHGVSFGSVSATTTSKGAMWAGIGPLVPGFIHVPSYNCYRCMFGKEYPECGIQCAKYLAEVIEYEGPDSVAAVILEPAMGAGGMIPPPPEYWSMAREICTKYDVLLIADEVATGFCRTGKMFAVEHWNIKPDMMTIAKGITNAYIPLGVTVFSDKVYEGVEGSSLPGNYTYTGHPVACAVGIKAMEIYLRDKIADHVTDVSKHFYERLEAEFQPLPCVGRVNGLGFFGGIEIVTDKATKRMFEPSLGVMERIQAEALQKGLYLRVSSHLATQGDRIAFSPPLVITREEIDRGLDILYPILANIKTV